MLRRPVDRLPPNSAEYETVPLVKPTGFREYDARWLLGSEINLLGMQRLGAGLGVLLARRGISDVVTGHDFRSYSMPVKHALVLGLLATGRNVHDIGLALSPMAYFAQFELGVPGVAMVTASHNENGWTGVKMGMDPPVTFGPEDMLELKEIVLTEKLSAAQGGSYRFVDDFPAQYAATLTDRPSFTRKLKAVVACGNGTAGAFVPAILERLGCEIFPLDCELDHSFPNYNPNPEDLRMLRALSSEVVRTGADIGFGFDGDGDRCGVVTEKGEPIYADKIGLMLARHLSRHHEAAGFVVDVKSTGLFATDPILKQAGARTDYWKTGHSHIKRRVRELGALAGFEKSGHFFFAPPIGLGYDDGVVTAIAVLDMLAEAEGATLSELYGALPKSWSSPTMSPHCPDEAKYEVVEQLARAIETRQAAGEELAGAPIAEIVRVNGIRVSNPDGTWGLVRASSNKPELVVVVESPVSEERMMDMFRSLDVLLRRSPQVGAYNQTFGP
ncbi:phosphomannomutase/phosphoglucomutase [Afifella pfennigii]|uniref:phosphomannomutase/phosphoglucomutase n=1 Tax=Afifella pfennigii TaxID=209897 RepID=UPI00047AE865|nr:phosphomannomutase/phosphoglucomutase [Afifella pfennigii]